MCIAMLHTYITFESHLKCYVNSDEFLVEGVEPLAEDQPLVALEERLMCNDRHYTIMSTINPLLWLHIIPVFMYVKCTVYVVMTCFVFSIKSMDLAEHSVLVDEEQCVSGTHHHHILLSCMSIVECVSDYFFCVELIWQTNWHQTFQMLTMSHQSVCGMYCSNPLASLVN